MNIFFLSYDPGKSAKFHCDKHVVKMILESVQMICTTHSLCGYDTPYKATHINHPCSIWVRESRDNYLWLLQLIEALHEEWRIRYNHNKQHKSYALLKQMKTIENELPDVGLTPPALAMPKEFRSNFPVSSYRQYYKYGKVHLHKWTNRNKPYWL